MTTRCPLCADRKMVRVFWPELRNVRGRGPCPVCVTGEVSRVLLHPYNDVPRVKETA